jgi:hypothetical protein
LFSKTVVSGESGTFGSCNWQDLGGDRTGWKEEDKGRSKEEGRGEEGRAVARGRRNRERTHSTYRSLKWNGLIFRRE